LRPASCRWALDSGGFTELSLHGRWVTPAEDYAAAVTAYADRIGGLDFAAPQDWMCEPFMIARTGLSVAEHLHRTVDNYVTLRRLAPDLPVIPVVQGWRLADYLTCVDLYASAGVDLAALPRVGLGSVCRRQSTAEIAVIVTELARRGLKLAGFGVKTGGLHLYGTCSPRPTRWPGAAPPAAPPPCPAALGTRTARTAWPTPPGGGPACSAGTPPAATRAACSTAATGRAHRSVPHDWPGGASPYPATSRAPTRTAEGRQPRR
jgi:hypothetical protein